jgi:hypothetical protein
VDEHTETLTAEDEPQVERPAPPEPTLTQRELVRASLLRCPPQPADGPAPR